MKLPSVEFSELALKGLERIHPDPERASSAKFSIEWFVKREETLHKSRRCPAFDDKVMFIFPLHDMRVLYERNGTVKVWSVKRAVESIKAPPSAT